MVSRYPARSIGTASSSYNCDALGSTLLLGKARRLQPRCGLGSCALLAAVLSGCGMTPFPVLSDEDTGPVDLVRYERLVRFVQLSDAQIVDEQSPGRVTALGNLSGSAWRPQEAYSTQLLDGAVRAVNKIHVALGAIDFVLFTGDATDNVQRNELDWFITAFDGGTIDPLTGPDDRDVAGRPDPLLDPHARFTAQGLYRQGVHGSAPTIPWYTVLGNHDRFAVGVFPIVDGLAGRRVAPLPLRNRIGLFLPVILDPTGRLSWAPISPARPGPPPELTLATAVASNSERRYVTDREFIAAHLTSTSQPPGHGFHADRPGQSWYSVAPVPGLRLIGLNSATPLIQLPGLVYSEGAISFPQMAFLRDELQKATRLGERVIVATHHPSDSLEPIYGTALTPQTFRTLLNGYPCVALHVAGHWHTDVVFDRGGYVEIVTGSIIDAPQRGRIIELWRRRGPPPRPDDPGGPPMSADFQLRYRFFSHLDEIQSPGAEASALFDDPLRPLRRVAAELAGVTLSGS
ncbi:MAG: hypothetical protein ACE5EX_00900 [Phycisphaerae bacterium]